MDAWGLVFFELIFFATLAAIVLRGQSRQYKVNKDIWGLYEQPKETQSAKAESIVLIFSRDKTTVKVESPDNPFNPNNPKRPRRGPKRAA